MRLVYHTFLGRPPFLVFRFNASSAKYLDPRSAVFLPPNRPSSCAALFLDAINPLYIAVYQLQAVVHRYSLANYNRSLYHIDTGLLVNKHMRYENL